MVHHTTWRTNNDVRSPLEPLELRRVALAAVDGQYVEAWKTLRIRLKRCRYLNRELARRNEHQGLWGVTSQIEALEDRQGKRGGLARTGLCLPEDIGAGQQPGNGLRLDGRWRLVADGGQSLEQRAAQAQLAKAGRWRIGHQEWDGCV